jgi:hypothetical protein
MQLGKIIIRNFLSVIFLLFAFSSSADFWSDLVGCLSDICNCGQPDRQETWGPVSSSIEEITDGNYSYPDGINFNKWSFTRIKKGSENCPPWNKFDARNNADGKNCFVQFDFPKSFIGSYRAYCAEASPESSFTKPYIRVRMQACNFFACFSFSQDLDASKGECTVWPTAWAVPTIRFCARVTNPKYQIIREEESVELSVDPGYQFHFLDKNGYPWPDMGTDAETEEGIKYKVYYPKVCAYEDPSILESFAIEHYRKTKYDIYDTDLYSQPYHETNLMNFSNNTNNAMQGRDFNSEPITFSNQVVEDKFAFNYNNNDINWYFDDIMKSGYTKYVPSTSEFPVKNETFLNNYELWVKQNVIGKEKSLGCTYLKIGPYPPPFCPLPAKPIGGLKTHNICPLVMDFDSDLKKYVVSIKKSTSISPCIRSEVNNNFIQNAIRVSNENFIPLCTRQQDPYSDSNCVGIYTANKSIESLHEIYNDHIPVCADRNPTGTDPCVITNIKPYCDGSTGSNCKTNHFRIIYGYQRNSGSFPEDKGGYPYDVQGTCGPSSFKFPCSTILGVDNGSYHDEIFDLSKISDFSYITTNKYHQNARKQLKISSTDNLSYSGYISTGGDAKEITTNDNLRVSSNSMCIYYENFIGKTVLAGCAERGSPPIVTKYSPLPEARMTYSGADAYFPKGSILLTYRPAISQPGSNVSIPQIEFIAEVGASDLNKSVFYNILGMEFQGFVIDEDKIIPPFAGVRAVKTTGASSGSSSLIGKYVGDPILKPDLTVNKESKYIDKTEYILGKYFRGGSNLVISKKVDSKCHTPLVNSISGGFPDFDNSNCVLTFLNYYDKINCKDFNGKNVSNICTDLQKTSCPQYDSMTLTGIGSIIFRSCSNDTKCIVPPVGAELPICKPSQSGKDRVIPEQSISLDTEVLRADEYYNYDEVKTGPCTYDPNNTQSPYNVQNCAARDKTPIENSVILKMPSPPRCSAESGLGNATWPAVDLGKESEAVCDQGFYPHRDMKKRLCFQDYNRNNPKLEERSPTDICVRDECDSEDTGNAIWPKAYEGTESVAVCKQGFTAGVNLKPRKCQRDGTELKLEQRLSDNLCTGPKCPLRYDSTEYWPETEPGEYAEAVCNSYETLYKPGDILKRKCIYDSVSKTSRFENLQTNMKCLTKECPGENQLAQGSGGATWSSVYLPREYGSFSCSGRSIIVLNRAGLTSEQPEKFNAFSAAPSGLSNGEGNFSRKCEMQPNGRYALTPLRDGARCRSRESHVIYSNHPWSSSHLSKTYISSRFANNRWPSSNDIHPDVSVVPDPANTNSDYLSYIVTIGDPRTWEERDLQGKVNGFTRYNLLSTGMTGEFELLIRMTSTNDELNIVNSFQNKLQINNFEFITSQRANNININGQYRYGITNEYSNQFYNDAIYTNFMNAETESMSIFTNAISVDISASSISQGFGSTFTTSIALGMRFRLKIPLR